MAFVTPTVLTGLTVVGFIGAVVTVGGVSSLTSLQGAYPYRFAWYLGAFALVAYAVSAVAIAVGFRRLRLLALSLLLANTSLLSSKIDQYWTFRDANNPTGQAGASVDAVLAGLIVIVIANFLLIITYAASEFEDAEHKDSIQLGSSASLAKKNREGAV